MYGLQHSNKHGCVCRRQPLETACKAVERDGAPSHLALSGPYHSMAARVTCLLPCTSSDMSSERAGGLDASVASRFHWLTKMPQRLYMQLKPGCAAIKDFDQSARYESLQTVYIASCGGESDQRTPSRTCGVTGLTNDRGQNESGHDVDITG